jgi:hypothetical protein
MMPCSSFKLILDRGSIKNVLDVVHTDVFVGSMPCNMLITKKFGTLMVLLCPVPQPTPALNPPSTTPLEDTQFASALLQDAIDDSVAVQGAHARPIPEPYDPGHLVLAGPFIFDPYHDSGPTPRSPTTTRPRARQSTPCIRPHDL